MELNDWRLSNWTLLLKDCFRCVAADGMGALLYALGGDDVGASAGTSWLIYGANDGSCNLRST